MTPKTGDGRYLIATTESGVLIIHSLPITLSWVPYDDVNHAYNAGGTITVGTFESLDNAKRAAKERYSGLTEDWQPSDTLPFDIDGQTEVHTPEIDGHHLARHGIRWK